MDDMSDAVMTSIDVKEEISSACADPSEDEQPSSSTGRPTLVRFGLIHYSAFSAAKAM